jgi:thymidylate synthase (FAD)
MCSFTQRSQRYCSENGFSVVVPKSLAETNERYAYFDLMEEIDHQYNDSQASGVPNEDARYILPNACCTDLYLSCNLRELIHIANERLCSKAQWEIRELVQKMVALVEPKLQFMLVPKCRSGRIICHTPCNKKEEK